MAELAPNSPLPGPEAVARTLLQAFDEVARLARPMSAACDRVSRAIGAPLDSADAAVRRACLAVARAVDDQHEFFDRHAYHNRRHFCEVVLTAHALCRVDRLLPRDTRRVLLAAMVHDLEHDGVAGGPFAYERRSVARAAPFLARAGVAESDFQALAGLVLSTDPHVGVPSAIGIRRWHAAGAPRGELEPVVPELQALVRSPSLSAAALVLCEADVLPSVGLSVEHALRLQDRLASEWGRRLGPDDKSRFIDGLLDAGVIGDFFRPNVLEIRRALREPADAAPC